MIVRQTSRAVSAFTSRKTHTPTGITAPPREKDTRPTVILGRSVPRNIRATSSNAARSVRYIRSSTRCTTPK